MKTLVAIVVAFVLQVSFGFAQGQTPSDSLFRVPQGFHFMHGSDQNQNANLQDPLVLRHAEPLFIVNADDRMLVIMPSATSGLTFNHGLPSDLQAIDADLIREITVYTGEEAINRFGQPARNGVIVIQLKVGSFEKLPAHLADRFSVKN